MLRSVVSAASPSLRLAVANRGVATRASILRTDAFKEREQAAEATWARKLEQKQLKELLEHPELLQAIDKKASEKIAETSKGSATTQDFLDFRREVLTKLRHLEDELADVRAKYQRK